MSTWTFNTFPEWVKRWYGQAFMERVIEGGYSGLRTHRSHYPLLDAYDYNGGYFEKVMAMEAAKEAIRGQIDARHNG